MGACASTPVQEESLPEELAVERSRASDLVRQGVAREWSTTVRTRTLPGYKPRAVLETQPEEEDRATSGLDPSAVLQVRARGRAVSAGRRHGGAARRRAKPRSLQRMQHPTPPHPNPLHVQ